MFSTFSECRRLIQPAPRLMTHCEQVQYQVVLTQTLKTLSHGPKDLAACSQADSRRRVPPRIPVSFAAHLKFYRTNRKGHAARRGPADFRGWFREVLENSSLI